MKKLLLSLVIISLGYFTYADNVQKVSANKVPAKKVVSPELKFENVVNPLSSIVEKKTSVKSDRVGDITIQEIGPIGRLDRTFGFGQEMNGRRVAYNRDINAVAFTNMFQFNPEDPEDEIFPRNVMTYYSVDGGKTFNSQIVTTEEQVLTNWPTGLLYNPNRSPLFEEAYIIAEGAAANIETSKFDSHFVASNLLGESNENTQIEIFRDNSAQGIVGISNPVGNPLSVNLVDNSFWQVLPQFDAQDNVVGVSILKTVKNASNKIETTFSKVTVDPHSRYFPYVMDWSPNGKYGVIAWLGYKEGLSEFLDSWTAGNMQLMMPMYLFSSDYGKTWSQLQFVELGGPDGVEALRDYYRDNPNFDSDVDDAYFSMSPRGFDVNVDKWGNLYFGGVITCNPDNESIMLPSPYGIIYNTSEQVANDPESNIRNIREAFYGFDVTGGYYMVYGDPEGEPDETKFTDFHRPQFVKNDDGSKLALMYADDKDIAEDRFFSVAPDLKGICWDLEKNIFSGVVENQLYKVINFTSDIDAVEGKVNCLSVSRYGIEKDNSLEIPVIYVDLYSMQDISNSMTQNYLQGVKFDYSKFLEDVELGSNPAPYDSRFPQVSLLSFPANNAGFVKGSGTYKEGTKVTIEALNSKYATFKQWEKEDGTLFSTDAKHTFSMEATSVNYIAIYDYNGPIGIKEENNSKVDAQVYPNPATDKLSVSCEGMTNVQIFDITGKVLLDKKVTSSNEEINISSLPNGMMFIKVITANGYNVSKVVKK